MKSQNKRWRIGLSKEYVKPVKISKTDFFSFRKEEVFQDTCRDIKMLFQPTWQNFVLRTS